jgi:hypothetical protein
VLLPQPDGPIKAVILLRGISIVISLIARLDPYQTERHRVDSTIESDVRDGAIEEAGAGSGGSFASRSARFSETLINGLVMKEEFSIGSALLGITDEPP